MVAFTGGNPFSVSEYAPMKKLLLCLLQWKSLAGFAFLFAACCVHAKPAHSLTVGEGFVDPLGFHDDTPVFSWKLPAGVKRQTAYRIEIKSGTMQWTQWDSGWIESPQSTFVPYGGRAFVSRQRGEWRVRFRDENGKDSGWSKYARFEMGLLSGEDWKAQWIRPQQELPDAKVSPEPVAWLRRQFSVPSRISYARLYVTARGVFRLYLNDKLVGLDHFANGWTEYTKRLDTLTYDVTDQLKRGENTLSAMLGTGWYAGRIGWRGAKAFYGKQPELLLQLEIAYKDGSSATIVSDGGWEGTYTGPVVSSSIYDGEVYDARREVGGWSPVLTNSDPGKARLTPKPFAPVRATQIVAVRNITEPEPGKFVFDLGQNIVGWAQIKVPVLKDRTVTLRFAEMLNKDGMLYTDNYRTAKSTDTYTPAENGTIKWEPHFTFHGFRYVEVSGLPPNTAPKPNWLSGVVLHSDLRRTGKFETSHAKLNQLQNNIIWGQLGNFLDIPTDCPQRDERCGWTGDAQVFCQTAMFNYDCHAFWKSWLGTMRESQFEDGRIPSVVPDILRSGDSPGWMDAAVIIPWEVYVRTGDSEVLAENYAMMEKLAAWYRGKCVDGLPAGMAGYGDWLQPYSSDGRKGDTPADLLGAAYFARDLQILANTARVLDRVEDEKRYGAEAAAVKAAFAKHYFDENGRVQNAPETQTGYVLAIAFDLLPHRVAEKAVQHLVRRINGEAGGHLRTGFLGTSPITFALDQMGESGCAIDLLFRESYPSWLYTVNQGATTMWERWNSFSRENGFGDAKMNSFNHYAYGAVGQWMYERIGGITPNPAKPGYKHFYIRPLIKGPLITVRAELETPYGKIVSAWAKRDGKLIMDVVVPPNTTATIEFPASRNAETVIPGAYRYELTLE